MNYFQKRYFFLIIRVLLAYFFSFCLSTFQKCIHSSPFLSFALYIVPMYVLSFSKQFLVSFSISFPDSLSLLRFFSLNLSLSHFFAFALFFLFLFAYSLWILEHIPSLVSPQSTQTRFIVLSYLLSSILFLLIFYVFTCYPFIASICMSPLYPGGTLPPKHVPIINKLLETFRWHAIMRLMLWHCFPTHFLVVQSALYASDSE